MSDKYKQISEITPAAKPIGDAKLLVVQGGKEYLIPLAAIIDPDPSLRSRADLDALTEDCVTGCTKRFINPARDTLEIWQLRADRNWHQIL